MARRYSRITSSARLRPALDKYLAYLAGTAERPSRVGTQGPRGNTKAVYVLPFGFDLPASTSIRSSVKPADYTLLSTFINGAGTGGEVVDTTSGDVEQRTGFTAARVVFFLNATRSITTPDSAVTGLKYLKYAGTRYSCPFGRKAVDSDMIDAFDAIKAAILNANTGAAVKRVSLSREKYAY